MFCRSEFPYYCSTVQPPVYLDSAATALKPFQVIGEIDDYLSKDTGNVHRLNGFQNTASIKYENARKIVADFINADSSNIIFTSGTTHSINMISASCFALDTVIITDAEHNANIIPWLLKNKQKNNQLIVFETEFDGSFDLDKFENVIKLNHRSLISLTHVNNVTGIELPIKDIVKISHQYDCKVFVDGAQAVTHKSVDIIDLDVDFYAFSAHKLYGPTGIGVLYAKAEHLNVMQPFFGGGGMVVGDVKYDDYRLADIPQRFEAGTPNIEGAIGLAAAIKWVNSHSIQTINKHIAHMYRHTQDALMDLNDIKILGNNTGSIVSFSSNTMNSNDIGLMLNAKGIVCRMGKLCATPYLRKFNVEEVVRISFGPYTNESDIDLFVKTLMELMQILR